MKKENRKINKAGVNEITGNRVELQPYLGQKFKVEAFVTNTLGFLGGKRLVTEIKFKGMFIKHAWFKSEKIGNLEHGYQKLDVEVVEYQDHINDEIKYGLKYIGTDGKKYQNDKLIKPKWMKW